MPEAVYRMMTLLCSVVAPAPVGTNLGLRHLLWMLVSGRLLATRGAVIPGLSACGLADRTVRRAWAARGQGDWASADLLARWGERVAVEGHWQPRRHGGYRPMAVDVTAFWRPRLRGCPTVHDHAEAGRALPAIDCPCRECGRPASGAAAGPGAGGCGGPAPRHPGAPAGARGGRAVRTGRGVGPRRGLRAGAPPGGGGDALRGAPGQE